MSATRRSGLGKGLSSLIPADVEGEGGAFREIDINHVRPNRYQPRDHFDEETLTALAASISEVGVIQPIIVREDDDGYELIAGGAALARREASRLAGDSRHRSRC